MPVLVAVTTKLQRATRTKSPRETPSRLLQLRGNNELKGEYFAIGNL
jgi:hypothetical protein